MFNWTNSYCDLSTEHKKSAYPGKNNHIEHFSQLAIWFQLIIIGRWSNCWWHESRRTMTIRLSSIHDCLSIDDHLTCSTCDFSLSLSLSLSIFFECFYSICFFFLRSFTPYTCVNNTVLVVIFYSLLLLRVLNIWSFLCNKKKIIQRLKFQSFKST